MYPYPFNKPYLVGTELEYIKQAIENMHLSGDGLFTMKCQALLEEQLPAPKVMLTTSCTDALELAALLINIQPGDEVIVPSFTFVSTINAFVLRGARPVFVDIRKDTLNIDETQVETKITAKTKAIIVVHYAGVACEMETIQDIASRHGLYLIEDNAHGLFGRYKGKSLGTFGSFGTQSFHETKNFTCGEGGALVINDEAFIKRAEIIREKGTNRTSFFRGDVDKYTWIDLGSSFLPSDMLAAYLFAQLQAREHIQAKRKRIWDYYYTRLSDSSHKHGFSLPTVPPECEQSYHLFYLVMPSEERRQALIKYLRDHGINSISHYVPLHLSPMGRNYVNKVDQYPTTEHISTRLMRLPFYNDLSEQQQAFIIATIDDYF